LTEVSDQSEVVMVPPVYEFSLFKVTVIFEPSEDVIVPPVIEFSLFNVIVIYELSEAVTVPPSMVLPYSVGCMHTLLEPEDVTVKPPTEL
jgi:hypothetical protein